MSTVNPKPNSASAADSGPAGSRAADVVVSGSGLVGSAFALAAADLGAGVAVIEPRDTVPARITDTVDVRVYALSLGSARFLASIGVWEHLEAGRVAPFRRMQVWDAASHGQIRFEAESMGVRTLGYIVEDQILNAAFERAMDATDGIEWYRPARVADVRPTPKGVRAVLDVGAVEGRLLVGADGVESAVRRCLRIQPERGSYGQRAIVTTVRTARGHEDTAWQRFLPGGPVAFLPLPSGCSSIVWSLPENDVEGLLELSDDAFAAALGHAFEWRLGEMEVLGARAAFPLRWLRAPSYTGWRSALIGDAAHTIHPLAGQGVNLGLMDAASLAELLADAFGQARDFGHPRLLGRYQRWRRAHNVYVQHAMDQLLDLFSDSTPARRWLRGTGLRMTDAIRPAKHTLGKLAMGLSGDLPRSYRTPRVELGE